MLFSPASKPRVLDKVKTLSCDGVIVDLEDAVGAHQKEEARENLIRFGEARTDDRRLFLVRVNAVGTPWFAEDLQAALRAGPDGIVLPKVENASDIATLSGALDRIGDAGGIAIVAMVESPLGVLNLREVASASPRMAGLILGSNDLLKDIGGVATPGREALTSAIGMTVLAARAYGLACLDAVYNAFNDAEGFGAECDHGRMMGFDGKTLIHPNQIETANAVFGPTQAAVDLARRKIAAFEQARAEGAGITVFEGEMLEELHINAARSLLDKAEMIAAMTQDGTRT
jgi:citrate lyase beta subunit